MGRLVVYLFLGLLAALGIAGLGLQVWGLFGYWFHQKLGASCGARDRGDRDP